MRVRVGETTYPAELAQARGGPVLLIDGRHEVSKLAAIFGDMRLAAASADERAALARAGFLLDLDAKP